MANAGVTYPERKIGEYRLTDVETRALEKKK